MGRYYETFLLEIVSFIYEMLVPNFQDHHEEAIDLVRDVYESIVWSEVPLLGFSGVEA